MDLIQKIKSEKAERTFSVERAHVNEDDRTVELAFSSETPVERWYGEEILDHSPSSVRMDRLQNGAAVLVNHDTDDHVGVVERAWIGDDRKGRALVRFGRSARADEVFQDVVDGIRSLVSVGYMRNDLVLERESDDVKTYRVTDWQPFEISLVAVPADASVGVGRQLGDGDQPEAVKPKPEMEGRQMPEEKKDDITPTAPVVDQRAIDDAADKKLADELARRDAINALAEKWDQRDLGTQFINNKRSIDEFREAVLERMGDDAPLKAAPESADTGMSERDIENFSFVRAMNALANPSDRRAQEAAAFERECSDAAAKVMQRTPQGILVPNEVLQHVAQRDLNVTTATAGGHTVSTDLLAASFIDLLRNRMVVNQMGATTLEGLVGDIAIPRQTGGATAYWVAESGAPTESQQAFDQVAMSPKTVGAFTDYSRKLLKQSSIGVEAFVRGDLSRVIALALDLAAMYGSGASNQPTGVVNTTGINTTTFAAADPTYAEIVAMETAVATDNADVGTLGYVMDAAMRGALKTTVKDAGSGQFVWEPGNTVNGYATGTTNQATDGDVIFGNWADLLIGMWGGLDLMADPYTGSTSGTVRIVALQDVDIAVRHPVSFCVSNDGV